jgi:hypothetical protein
MHPDSRYLIGIVAMIFITAAGCSTLPGTDRTDWSGAHPFTLSNRVPGKFKSDTDFWGVQYEVDGVFKPEVSTGLIHFRIDRLEMNRNPKYPDQKIYLTSLQMGLCHYLADGRKWEILPKQPLGKTNSKDLSMTIKLDKTYRIDHIGPMSILSDETLDLHKVWPCSQLWNFVTTPDGKTTNGDYPAHEIALTTIL